jgi:hypothetical protein
MALKHRFARLIAPAVDAVVLCGLLLWSPFARLFRAFGPQRLPASRWISRRLGVWPLRRHYYDPLFDPMDLSRPLESTRNLPGINWNVSEQLKVLAEFRYASELSVFLKPAAGTAGFSFENDTFVSGDADYLYSFIRRFKPQRIIEVGCGNSTRLILAANTANTAEDTAFKCQHVCIEPFEAPWLEGLGVEVIRQRVEALPQSVFTELSAGDLLFIDSSHIIRPNGDVLFEILELLPLLSAGVYCHFHDIFSPRNYLPDWLKERGYLWNEQYLLEAFLSGNSSYRIIGALNFLHHNNYAALHAICANHREEFEPGSFYIQRC